MSDDLAERWAPLLETDIAQAACVTWVRGVSPEESFMRLGGLPPFTLLTLANLDAAITAWAEEGDMEPLAVLGITVGEWTVLVEPRGLAATIARNLARLSSGTEAISIFWNANALAEITVARDEQVMALVHDVLDYVCGEDGAPAASIEDVQGSEPHLVRDLIDALAKIRGHDWQPAALEWAERRTNARIPRGALETEQGSLVFPKEGLQ